MNNSITSRKRGIFDGLSKRDVVFYIIALAICAVFFWFLFNCQVQGLLRGDLRAHLRSAIGTTNLKYSMNSMVYLLFHLATGDFVLVPIYLALISTATIPASYRLLLSFDPAEKSPAEKRTLLWISVLPSFIMSIYVPLVYEFYYRGCYTPNAFHNDTSITMRFFAVIAVSMYFEMRRSYLDKFPWGKAALFTAMLFCANYCKPNFVIAFAPLVLIFLVKDFITCLRGDSILADKLRKIRRMLYLGICVLVSMIPLLYQYYVLYILRNSGGIDIGYTPILLKDPSRQMLRILCGLPFCLLVLGLFLYDFFKRRKNGLMSSSERFCFAFLYVMLWANILVVEVFSEYGNRAKHGNFGWGKTCALYFVFLVAFYFFARFFKDSFFVSKKRWQKVVSVIGCCLAFLHLVSGICFLVTYLSGGKYYI